MDDQIAAWLFTDSGLSNLDVIVFYYLGIRAWSWLKRASGNLPRRTIMSLLNRDQILTADDLVFEEVPVPEWGGTVRVRTITGTERDTYETRIRGDQGGKARMDEVRSALVAAAIVDEDGHRVFTDQDVAKLKLKSAKPIDRVFEVAARLSGLDEEDEGEKAAAADFDDAQSGPSTSD